MGRSRRRFVAAAGLIASTVLAGCSSQTADDSPPPSNTTDMSADAETDSANESTNETTQTSTDESADESTDETTNESTNENSSTDEAANESTNETTAEGESNQTSTDETANETTPRQSAPAAVTIDNIGFSAWEVTSDSTGSVAPTGERNPTMTLTVGRRYVITNNGGSAHPFAIRSEAAGYGDDTPLLSQSADGRYESDTAVNWQDDGDTVAFTVTEDLAAAADYYICTAHRSMRGEVAVSA